MEFAHVMLRRQGMHMLHDQGDCISHTSKLPTHCYCSTDRAHPCWLQTLHVQPAGPQNTEAQHMHKCTPTCCPAPAVHMLPCGPAPGACTPHDPEAQGHGQGQQQHGVCSQLLWSQGCCCPPALLLLPPAPAAVTAAADRGHVPAGVYGAGGKQSPACSMSSMWAYAWGQDEMFTSRLEVRPQARNSYWKTVGKVSIVLEGQGPTQATHTRASGPADPCRPRCTRPPHLSQRLLACATQALHA